MSFSPETGLVYIPAQETPIVFGDENPYEYKPGFWNVGSNFILASLPTDEATADAVRAMLKGRLIAWDPATQKQVWSVEYKGPWNGGVLSTAGGLVFQGTADAQFAAYDAATGAKLWSKPTQTGVVAAPIAYEIDGEQYVAVAAGWGGVYALVFGGLAPPGSVGNVGRVLVFKLGGSATLPPIEAKSSLQPALPAMTASAEVLAAGFAAYAQRCLVCHGDRAHSYGALPDLRYSPVLADADEWRAIVVDGARAEKGMASFATAFDPDTAEAIRAYVLSEATASR
jgi:quinohemoprotein ethanol dehydrogenase